MTEKFIDIKVRTGGSKSEVSELNKEMVNLGVSSDKAENEINTFSKSANNLTASTKKLSTITVLVKKGIDDLGKSAKTSSPQIKALSASLESVDNSTKEFKRSSQEITSALVNQRTELTKAEAEYKEFETQIISASGAIHRCGQVTNALGKADKALTIDARLLKKVVREEKQEIKNLNKELRVATKAEKELSVATDKANKSFNNQIKSSKAAKSGISGVGRGAGQAGIQVQQFIGQIQGGQNAMLALSQQSADLGFVLGAPLLGAVVGISASIAGLLLPNLFKSNENIIDITESAKRLSDEYNTLNAAQKKVAKNLLVIQLNEQKKSTTLLAIEINKLETAYIAISKASRGTRFFETLFSEDPEKAKKALDEARGSLIILGEEYKKTKKAISDLGKNDNVTKLLDEQRESIGNLTGSLLRAQETLGLNNRQLALYKASLLGSNDGINSFINAQFDLIDAKKQDIETTKEQLKQDDLSNKNKKQVSVFANNLAVETEQLRLQLELRDAIKNEFINKDVANEALLITNKLNSNQLLFDAQFTKLGEDEVAKAELLALFREQQLIAVQEFQANITDIESIEEDKRTKLAEAGNKRVLNSKQQTNNALIGLLSVFAGKSKAAAIALLAIQKAHDISATISGALAGSVKVYGELPYPAAVVASGQIIAQGNLTAGLIAATGFGQAIGIASGGSKVSTSSSIGGGASINTGVQPIGPQTNQTRVVDIRIDQNALLSAATVQEIITSALSTNDDIVVQITESQQELDRVGG